MTASDIHDIWLQQATYAVGFDFCCFYHSGDDAFHFHEIQHAQ